MLTANTDYLHQAQTKFNPGVFRRDVANRVGTLPIAFSSTSTTSSQQPQQPLSEAELYNLHEDWFRAQRKHLLRFLELTQGQAQAKFSLTLPTLLTLPGKTNRGANSNPSQTLCFTFSRSEILSVMTDYIGQVRQVERIEREELAQAQLVGKITLWRWQAAQEKGQTKLAIATRNLLVAFGCLASGVTDSRQIATKLQLTVQSARSYRQYLVDAVLFHAFWLRLQPTVSANNKVSLSA